MTLIVAAGAIPTTDMYVKILIQGRSGSGKTTLGAKMPKPLILLTEANGLPSIRAANPGALVIRIYDPKAYGKTTQFQVLQEAMNLAATRAFDGHGVESIVADSATEIQRIIKEEILREKGVLNEPGYVMTQQDWGLLTERTRRWARAFRDLPYHTMMITLTTEEKDDETGAITLYSPQFEGKKLPGEILQFSSAGGYAYKVAVPSPDGGPDEIVHRVMFQGKSAYVVKPTAPLRHIEHDDPSDWISRVVNHKPGEKPLDPLPKLGGNVKAPPASPPATTGDAKAAGEKQPEGSTTSGTAEKSPAAPTGGAVTTRTVRTTTKKAESSAEPS
jgi:hypothetical protein